MWHRRDVSLAKAPLPVLPDVTELKFEHGASHRRCTIKWKQVPIEPGFSITAHKAQGKTLQRVVVDRAGCSGTEAPYVMVSRATTLCGLGVLRGFDIKQITKRPSEDLRRDFARLTRLKLRNTMIYGEGEEVQIAKAVLGEHQGIGVTRGMKRGSCVDVQGRKKKIDHTTPKNASPKPSGSWAMSALSLIQFSRPCNVLGPTTQIP
jgi:hypothetical protein